MPFAIFVGQAAGISFEYVRKVALRGKPKVGAYCRNGLVGVTQQPLCLRHLFFQNKVYQLFSRFLFELHRQAAAAYKQRFCHVFGGYCLRDVAVHGIYGAGTSLDETLGLIETVEKAAQIYMLTAHLPRINTIKDEDMLKLLKLFNVTNYRKDFLDLK